MKKRELKHLEILQEQIKAKIQDGKFVDARRQLLEMKASLYELNKQPVVNGIVGADIKLIDLKYYEDWSSDVAIDRFTRIQAELQLSQFEAEMNNFI